MGSFVNVVRDCKACVCVCVCVCVCLCVCVWCYVHVCMYLEEAEMVPSRYRELKTPSVTDRGK